jgi:uncharacterized protein (TIGR04552 family)
VSEQETPYRTLDEFLVHDLEGVRMLLRGGTVIDWHRLNLEDESQAADIVRVQEIDLDDPEDRRYVDSIRDEAVGYLKRTFDFPVPGAVRVASLVDLLMMASGRGHRQVCACSVLKVMHVIHHLKAAELRVSLPLSDQEMFDLLDAKVYRVIGSMLGASIPVKDFMGGRKHRDGQYTKLLAKQDNIAARIYDKIRFRLVTRQRDDIFPVLNHLMRRLFPFNYVIPQQSTNTLVPFKTYVENHPHLRRFRDRLQMSPELEDTTTRHDNFYSDPSFRIVHFVVDLPVRIDGYLRRMGITATRPGPVIFCLTEFQLVDQETDATNEQGTSSHAAYKERQRLAVEQRLKLGSSRARSPEVKTRSED